MPRAAPRPRAARSNPTATHDQGRPFGGGLCRVLGQGRGAPFHPVDGVQAQFDRVRAACEKSGRDPATMTLSVAVTVCCGRDSAEVERRAEAIGKPAAAVDVAGTPAEVVDKLQAYAAVGATRAYLQVIDLDDLDHIRLLGAEVLPQLA